MEESFGAASAAAFVSPTTRQATTVVARGQAIAYLNMNAWSYSAGMHGYFAVSRALSESAAMLRGDHFVNFVYGSGILSTNCLSNMRIIQEMHSPMVEQYVGYSADAAGQTPPDAESVATFDGLSDDHKIMQQYVARLLGGFASNRWPRPMPISQTDLYPGDPVATGQALVNARLSADREAYFVAICGVSAQFARMAQKEALSGNLLAFAAIAGSDYWNRLGTLTGLVGLDDGANLAAARSAISALEESYAALAAAASAAGDGGFAAFVSAKLGDVQAIAARLESLQIP